MRRVGLLLLPSCVCAGPWLRAAGHHHPFAGAQLALARASRARVLASSAADGAVADSGPARALHPAALPLDDLLREVTMERTRRSGPGGQHRNKVESAVVALHVPTGVRAEASERRSQHENREIAVARLRLRLALDVRSAPPLARADDAAPPAHAPSALWRARRTGAGKMVVSDKHPDFPALVAEALDAIGGRAHDVRAAADDLGVSTSQLVKLLAAAQPALQRVNEARKQAGMAPLKG